MAFDLLRLQILQETLDIIKNSPKPYVGMCDALTIASIELIDITYSIGYYPIEHTVPVTTRIIRRSLIIRYAPENPTYRYLWKLNKKGQKKRIRYLERLIEDEMSGTYFMEMKRGF